MNRLRPRQPLTTGHSRSIPIPDGVPTGMVIGKGGCVVKELEATFGCRVRVDNVARKVNVSTRNTTTPANAQAVEDKLCEMFEAFAVNARCSYSHAKSHFTFVPVRGAQAHWTFEERSLPPLDEDVAVGQQEVYRYQLLETPRDDLDRVDCTETRSRSWIQLDEEVAVCAAFDRIAQLSIPKDAKWKAACGVNTFKLRLVEPDRAYAWSQLVNMTPGTHLSMQWCNVLLPEKFTIFESLYERLLPELDPQAWRSILKVHLVDTLNNASFALKYHHEIDGEGEAELAGRDIGPVPVLKRAYGHRNLVAHVAFLQEDSAGFRLRLVSRQESAEARELARKYLNVRALEASPQLRAGTPCHIRIQRVEHYQKQHVTMGGLRWTLYRSNNGTLRVEARVNNNNHSDLSIIDRGMELREKLQLFCRRASAAASNDVRPENEEALCVICFDQCGGDARDVVCTHGHRVCMECFIPFLEAEFGKDLGVLLERKGQVECPAVGCNYCYSNLQIASSGNAIAEKWKRLMWKLGERDALSTAQIKDMTKQDAVRKQLEDALNLKCPHCEAVFTDYDGCDAVTCHRCHKYFCGLCLEPFNLSSNAHQHAASCSVKANTSDQRSHYSAAQVRTQAHRRFVKNRLENVLNGYSRIEREKIKADFSQMLKEYL